MTGHCACTLVYLVSLSIVAFGIENQDNVKSRISSDTRTYVVYEDGTLKHLYRVVDTKGLKGTKAGQVKPGHYSPPSYDDTDPYNSQDDVQPEDSVEDDISDNADNIGDGGYPIIDEKDDTKSLSEDDLPVIGYTKGADRMGSEEEGNCSCSSERTFKEQFISPVQMRPAKIAPISGESALVYIQVCCPERFNISHLVLLDRQGEPLEKETPQQCQETETGVIYAYIFHVITPREPFYLSVKGDSLDQGKFTEKLCMVNPRQIGLSFATPAFPDNLSPVQIMNIKLRVRNRGYTAIFNTSAVFSCYRSYLNATIYPKSIEIEQDRSKIVNIFVSAHESITQRISSLITISVKCPFGTVYSLKRMVEASPESFDEDKEPPSCTICNKDESFNNCDPDFDCESQKWGVSTKVWDASGVYKAHFSSGSSSMEYKTVNGRLALKAHLIHNCCSQNVSLYVEDYIGNTHACLVTAPKKSSDFMVDSNTNATTPVTSQGPESPLVGGQGEGVSDGQDVGQGYDSTIAPDVREGTTMTVGLINSLVTTTDYIRETLGLNPSSTEPTTRQGVTQGSKSTGDPLKHKLFIVGIVSSTIIAVIVVFIIIVLRFRDKKSTTKGELNSSKNSYLGMDNDGSDRISLKRFSTSEDGVNEPQAKNTLPKKKVAFERDVDQSSLSKDYTSIRAHSHDNSESTLTHRSTQARRKRAEETECKDLSGMEFGLGSGASEKEEGRQPNYDLEDSTFESAWLAKLQSSEFSIRNNTEICESVEHLREALDQLERKKAAIMASIGFAEENGAHSEDEINDREDANINEESEDDLATIGVEDKLSAGSPEPEKVSNEEDTNGNQKQNTTSPYEEGYATNAMPLSSSRMADGQVPDINSIERESQILLRREITKLREKLVRCNRDVEELLRREHELFGELPEEDDPEELSDDGIGSDSERGSLP